MNKEAAKKQLRSLLEEIAERMAEVSIVVESIGPEATDAYGAASDALEDLSTTAQ